MSTWLQDIRHAARVLGARPGFTLAAVLSLALGIAANTTIFSVIQHAVLNPVPFEDAERLVALAPFPEQNPDQRWTASIPEYWAWKEQATSFEIMGAFRGNSRVAGAADGSAPPERFQVFQLDTDAFRVFNIQPVLGRLFTDEEGRHEDPAPVVLISHRLWEQRYGADPGVLGEIITIDGIPTTIIGVMPAGLSEALLWPEFELYLPWEMPATMQASPQRFIRVYARLRPDVSLAQAQAELDAIALQLAQSTPQTHEGFGLRAHEFREWRDWNLGVRDPLVLLQGAVALVLLIACANVAVLLLAASASRHTEIAVRSAIGAGRRRLVRQFLTESLLLSVLGGVLGLLLAWVGIRLFVGFAPPGFPRVEEVAINGAVLAFTAGVVVLTAAVFGLFPALQGSRPDLSVLLNETPRGSTGSAARSRFRTALVTGQTGLALILLIGAGLLINSLMRLQDNPLGADPRGILTFWMLFAESEAIIPTGRTHVGSGLWDVNPDMAPTFERIHDRLRNVPGVESVAGTNMAPFVAPLTMVVHVQGRETPDTQASARYAGITPGYFETMRVPLLRGRDFTAQDHGAAPLVVIVNETLARQRWPDEDPIGQHLRLEWVPDEPLREVVGVVGDVLRTQFAQEPQPALYVPQLQQPDQWRGPGWGFAAIMTYLIRAPGDPLALAPSVQSAVAEIAPDMPLADLMTLEQSLGSQLQENRMYTLLLVVFGGVAGILAAVGLYGVIAYTVAERRQEFGIRMALGAARPSIVQLVMRHATLIVASGLGVGLVGSLALTRLLESVLWGVTPTDPATFAAVCLMLIAVALIACLVPTRRAMATDPAVALRRGG